LNIEEIGMPIYQTAHYQVTADAVPAVRAAIEDFVAYVKANEPGTHVYSAWQQRDDPTRFVHLFTFADEAAHEAHGASDAVRRFEAVYRPVLVGGPVVFTDYELVADVSP
jgi:quinol monooxygenase YgiN